MPRWARASTSASSNSAVYDVLLESASIAEARQRSEKGGYDVLGANRELAGAEIELVPLERRNRTPARRAGDHRCRLRLRPDRLPAVAEPAHAQRPVQRARRDRADAVRVLRARGPLRPGQHHQAGARQPQSRAAGHRPVARDVRPAHHAAAAGQRAARSALRRQGVQRRDPAQRAPGRGTELRPGRRGVRPDVQGRAWPISSSRTRWSSASRRSHEGAAADLASTFDAALLSRVEDAGLNASAPPQQRWLDGWLVRFSPGKAKRARCVNAVAAGRLPLDEKLARARSGVRRSAAADGGAHHAVQPTARSRAGSSKRRAGRASTTRA